MSGHSKWSTIKRKKAKTDQERGRIFTRLTKELTIAARHGGGDPEGNPRLRSAVDAARKANMPSDNIKKAIQKGTGELPGVSYEEASYEGYGPGGVAIYVETLSDNKNRTVAEIRHLFSRFNGNLGENGSVAWMFQRLGQIAVNSGTTDEDTLMMLALDAGASDVAAEDSGFLITTEFGRLYDVKAALEGGGVEVAEASIAMVPQNTIKLEGKPAEQMLRLMEALEEHDDVQNVYANFDIDESVMEQFDR
jgi:YebC/PmpR family DNA-binding regulatory protein